MYELPTFLKDLRSAFGRVPKIAKWTIVIMQLVLGFQALMVCGLAFGLPLAESLTYSFFLPALAIWIPVLWKKWERSE
ncbi:MAG: hypothetical protein R2780_05885 [Crocinitomicaceae bacterium]|nr:hypothetical protein [Crocinitomicaceae bacterium]